ncbi:MAG: extracellular solute-binding protein [Lachnospiraceae bacterium]|nr:extracellular solute-binding protein [Lachnospiraceae bacterium]
MKRKKLLALALSAVMVMSMAAGCGSNSSSGGGASNSGTGDTATEAPADSSGDSQSAPADGEVQAVSLKVWTPEEEMEITQQMCDKFNEDHPEFDCTFDIVVVGIDESVNNLETDADTAADVFLMPSGSIPQLVEEGLIYPITYDQDNVMSLYGEGAIEACSRDGLLYAVPSSPNSWFMYYNKNLYSEDDVKSLETMMAKDLGDDIANFSCTVHNSWYIEAFFYAAGCTLFGEDGSNPNDCTWNNEDGFKAGQYLIDLVNNPKYVEDEDGLAGSLMKDGKLAALCSGTWAANDIKEALGDGYAACALPTITIDGKECQLSNFADYKCHAVKSNTAYPLAAQQLCEYLDAPENQLIRYEEASETPTALSLLDNPELAEDAAALALVAQTQYATPQPAISQMNEYWTPAEALGTGIVNKEITEANLQQQLDALVESVTTKLAE